MADERFGYYLAVNHLFGIVGTLGRDGVADEGHLLADLAAYLAAKARETSPVPPLVATLLGAPRLRVKANLRTRLDDMDELGRPLDSSRSTSRWPTRWPGWHAVRGRPARGELASFRP